MGDVRKKRSAQEKAKIAIEAIKEELTTAQISSKYGVNNVQISNWKKQLLEGVVEIFSGRYAKPEKDQSALIEELYKQIGQLSVERDWLKKKSESLY
jgi:transposase-like protein